MTTETFSNRIHEGVYWPEHTGSKAVWVSVNIDHDNLAALVQKIVDAAGGANLYSCPISIEAVLRIGPPHPEQQLTGEFVPPRWTAAL